MYQRSILPQTLLIALFLLLLFQGINAQTPARFTVSGFIYEKGSRETLIGVNVYEPRLRMGAVSNNYGFYTLTLPADSIELVFSFVGYQSQIHKISLQSNMRLDIELSSSIDLSEVVVEAERIARISEMTQMSVLDVPIRQMRAVPSLLGEKDMFKVLQLLPGVQSGNEGFSGFYVRGGGPDQNLIILDDAIVYNASHLFGFFSVFNGDAIKNMLLYKGGFPARFGGRLSSVLDIQMKDGNKEKFEGEAGIGLISSRLTLEGPIVKDKASFLVSGRRTYIDVLTRPLMPSDGQGGYFFYDLNAKFNYDLDKNNRIFLSGYFGRDKFFFRYRDSDSYSTDQMESGLFWQNATSTLRWNHVFNDRLFANTTLIFSDYTLQIYSEEEYQSHVDNYKRAFEFVYNSGIQDVGLKYDLGWNALPNHYIRAGVSVLHHHFTPSAFVVRDDDIGKLERTAEKLNSIETGIYAEDEIRVQDFLTINPGLRLSLFMTNGKNYTFFEPRFSSNLRVADNLSWKASYAAMSQYVHLLSTTGVGLPTDLWVPSTDRIPPQKTWQVATGFAYDWLNRNLELSIEGYYKKANDVIGYKPGASFLLIDDPSAGEDFSWQNTVTKGEGWAYGVEFLVQRKLGKLSGWIGYTLSWTQHRFDEINFGEKFWARYDRRHDVSVVGIYEVAPSISLSATWVYATGNAFDLATGRFPLLEHHPAYEDSNYSFPYWMSGSVYNKKNSFRGGAYHRLDFAAQFHKNITIFGNPVKRSVELGLYNAYSRKNPFFYYWRDVYQDHPSYNPDTGKRKLMQVSIFPIIPSVSLNYKF